MGARDCRRDSRGDALDVALGLDRGHRHRLGHGELRTPGPDGAGLESDLTHDGAAHVSAGSLDTGVQGAHLTATPTRRVSLASMVTICIDSC